MANTECDTDGSLRSSYYWLAYYLISSESEACFHDVFADFFDLIKAVGAEVCFGTSLTVAHDGRAGLVAGVNRAYADRLVKVRNSQPAGARVKLLGSVDHVLDWFHILQNMKTTVPKNVTVTIPKNKKTLTPAEITSLCGEY